MQQRHEYADILEAIARGDEIQSLNTHKDWEDIPAYQAITWIANRKPVTRFRIKPKTIRIGGYDIPEPMRESPEIGTHYYLLNLDGLTPWDIWADDDADNNYLEAGLAFKTREDVMKVREAILSLLRKPSK